MLCVGELFSIYGAFKRSTKGEWAAKTLSNLFARVVSVDYKGNCLFESFW